MFIGSIEKRKITAGKRRRRKAISVAAFFALCSIAKKTRSEPGRYKGEVITGIENRYLN